MSHTNIVLDKSTINKESKLLVHNHSQVSLVDDIKQSVCESFVSKESEHNKLWLADENQSKKTNKKDQLISSCSFG